VAEKALTAVIQDASVQGISTGSVDALVKALGMAGASRSQVSRLCEAVDEGVRTFLDRPREGDWPDLWIDATHVQVRATQVSVALSRDLESDLHSRRRPERVGGARPWARRCC
jgi:putative transposase